MSQSTMYARSPFGATRTSPPAPAFRSDVFGQPSSSGSAQIYGTSPTAERHLNDRSAIMPALSTSTSDPMTFGLDSRPAPAVVIRRLPRTIGAEALRSMLIFAGDLIDTEFIRSPYPDDHGFATAVARFQTSAGAFEAQQKLHGKPNTTKEANMIVEAHGGSAVGGFERRNTIDVIAPRTQTSSTSSASSHGAPPARSRFGSTFQSSEKLSPPLPTSSSSGPGELPIPENSAHFQNLFSPQSPLANGVNGIHRVSGKSMINDDSADDETGELLKDPVAYAKNGHNPAARRATNPQVPVARFGSLSLSTPNGVHKNTHLAHAASNGYTSPRADSIPNNHKNLTPLPPPQTSPSNHVGPNGGPYSPASFPRPQYPPVNPADQNPPCNTLYVGNLPIDTSEDELKSLFSKQRGYKRLCFRTKQNGPMCFVEFEDVSFATKALHELYGHPLHNSVKGGIRLSFSKNPLGVRSGQTSAALAALLPGATAAGSHHHHPHHHHHHPVMSPQALSAPPGYGGAATAAGLLNNNNNNNTTGNFSSVSGPPPGLGTPPGLAGGGGSGGAATAAYRSPATTTTTTTGMDAMFSSSSHRFGMPSPHHHHSNEFISQLASPPLPRNYSGGIPPTLGSGTYGRDSRNSGFADYSMGR